MSTKIRMHVSTVPGAKPERDAIVDTFRENPRVDLCVHPDPSRNGIVWNWVTMLRCMADDAAQGYEWVVTMDDDLIQLPDWEEHFHVATEHSPTPLLNLTYFGKIGADAAAEGYPYVVGHDLVWGCALAYHLPSIDLPDLIAFAEDAHGVGFKFHDTALDTWAATKGIKMSMVSRALFTFREEVRSYFGRNLPNRYPKATIQDPGPWYTLGSREVRRKRWPEQDALLRDIGRA